MFGEEYTLVAVADYVLGARPGMLDGMVTDARQQPDANVTVVLAPDTSHRQRAELFRNLHTDASGQFHLENIPPGDYVVLAWEDIEPLAWQDPEFLRKYENRASPIHIETGDRVNVRVTAIPAE